MKAHPPCFILCRLRRAIDEVVGDVFQRAAGASGLLAQFHEGLVDGDAEALGEDTFGLFDDDSAVEGLLKLVGERFALGDDVLLEDAERCRVRQGLHEGSVSVTQRPRACREQAQGPKRLIAQPHGGGVNGAEPTLLGDGYELWPEFCGGGQVRDFDGFTHVEAVPTRSFSSSQLCLFDVGCAFAARGQHVQSPVGVGEDDPAFGRGREGNAGLDETVEDVDDIGGGLDAVGQALEDLPDAGLR